MNVSDALLKLVELTNENLNLLNALNDSFYSKNAHIQTDIQGKKFTIPSFLSLENKVNHLQDAFDNLVHSAKSGDAWMNFDGNSKEIKLVGYNPMGNPIELALKNASGEDANVFFTKTSSYFKDMLTPCPYLNFEISTLPDNVSQVNVRKVVLNNSTLIARVQAHVKNNGGSEKKGLIDYMEFKNMLIDQSTGDEYIEGTDYTYYDTVYNMEVRSQIGTGEYVIEKVISDYIADSLDEYITVRVSEDTPLKWTRVKDNEEINLETGCKLTNYDGAAQFEITEIHQASRTMKLHVLHGSYINLEADQTPTDGVHSDYSILKFLCQPEQEIIQKDKSLQVPLEEDQYIIIYASPITPTTRIQAVWSSGLYLDVHKLTNVNGGDDEDFITYYKNNVTNIGDCLAELTQTMQSPITNFTSSQYSTLVNIKPVFEVDNDPTVAVVQINKHMNDSEAAKNIRSLYGQKKQYQTRINDVTSKINDLETDLANVSFDDQTGTRGMYETQISELRKQYNELYSSLMHIIDSITTSANDTQIPIEAAKYRIRGYIDVEEMLDRVGMSDVDLNDVRGVHIQYRYKNPDIPQANVSVINDFLFTEWTDQFPNPRTKDLKYINGSYTGSYSDIKIDADGNEFLDITSNQPKFNQVDIPINQGEIVDIRARIIWAFGYPFSQVTSEWSDVYTVEFPDELVKDVQLKTIIDENNDDIETYRFNNIIRENGMDTHVQDKIQDQDITYFHKPENIASGFYTAERRIIPLRDKLTDMNKDLLEVLDLVKGTTSDAIAVTFSIGTNEYDISQGINNNIHLQPYGSVKAGTISNGPYMRRKSTGAVQAMGSIKITNTTQHNVHLYSIFPGPRDTGIHKLIKTKTKFDSTDYIITNSK